MRGNLLLEILNSGHAVQDFWILKFMHLADTLIFMYHRTGLPNPYAKTWYQAMVHSEPGHTSGRCVHLFIQFHLNDSGYLYSDTKLQVELHVLVHMSTTCADHNHPLPTLLLPLLLVHKAGKVGDCCQRKLYAINCLS